MGVITPKGELTYSLDRAEDGTVTISVEAIDADGSLYIPASWGTVAAGSAAVTKDGDYNVVALSKGHFTITVTP